MMNGTDQVAINKREIAALKSGQYIKLDNFARKVFQASTTVSGDATYYLAKKTVTFTTTSGANPAVAFGLTLSGISIGSTSGYPVIRRLANSTDGVVSWSVSIVFAPAANTATMTAQVISNLDGILAIS